MSSSDWDRLDKSIPLGETGSMMQPMPNVNEENRNRTQGVRWRAVPPDWVPREGGREDWPTWYAKFPGNATMNTTLEQAKSARDRHYPTFVLQEQVPGSVLWSDVVDAQPTKPKWVFTQNDLDLVVGYVEDAMEAVRKGTDVPLTSIGVAAEMLSALTKAKND